MKLTIYKTNNVLQYRNMYFANISAVVVDGIIYGYEYTDGDKIWYALFFLTDQEDVIILPNNCHYGESCIYAHDLDAVEYLCSEIAKIPELTATFPTLSSKVEEFAKELYL